MALYPQPPLNTMVVSPFGKGVLDIRWDDPSLIGANTEYNVVGVNIYRSEASDRGPFKRLNSYPVSATFYRDFTDVALVSSEVIPWEGGWQSKGDAPNAARWTLKTRYPIAKPRAQGVPANSPEDVLVTIDGVPAWVGTVFGQTGEITLQTQVEIDPRDDRNVESPLPGPNSAVVVSYYTARNVLYPNTMIDRKLFYRVTTVAVAEGSTTGYIETPLDQTMPASDMQIEQLDYIWREAMRRNRWILEQGGERVKLFVQKVSGMPCPCRSETDPQSRAYNKQPSNRCHVCFVPGTEVTMADFTRKPIELIQVGDEVLTHKGRVRPVTQTMERSVCEDVVTIEATQGVGFTATSNHPILIVNRADAIAARKAGTGARAQWVDAGSVQTGDYLAFPVGTEDISEAMTRDRLRFLGYYAAEGWTSLKQGRGDEDKVVRFGFHTQEASTYVDELRGIVEREFDAKLCYHQCSNTANGIQVTLSSTAPVPVALEHVGKYSKHKRLSRRLVWQPVGGALDFLGAYLNGDGWECHNAQRTHIGCSSASEDMARQIEGMLLRCGAVPRFDSRTRVLTNPSRPGTHETTEFTVAIRKNDMALLAGHMDLDLSGFAVRKAGGWAFRSGTLVLYPIKKVALSHYHGPVHNLEVAEDHTYVAGGATVHNCYGTGYVGGFEGPYDILMAPDDAEKRISQTPNGRRKEHSYEVWTSFSPIISMRDFVLKQNNERYSVGPVRRPTNRGNVMQQHFNIAYIDPNDIRYDVPVEIVLASPNLPWPQTRYPYRPYRETYDKQTGAPWSVTPDAVFPMATDKGNVPDGTQIRWRSGTGENQSY